MAQKEARTEQAEKSPLFNFAAADFAVTAKRQIEAITKAQSEALDNFQEMNQQWLDRIQAEASLASDLASKLTAARSSRSSCRRGPAFCNHRALVLAAMTLGSGKVAAP